MLVSLHWLQKYFADSLPPAEELRQQILFRAFEVEEVKLVGADTVLDVKILPDRASDCLSHRGIARELGAILDRPVLPLMPADSLTLAPEAVVAVDVAEPKLCPRYVARVVTGVTVSESPAWLKLALETIGQRAINNVVDLANYLMFDLGQPLHAFDADKVIGSITVRLAKAGEKLTTLDNQELALDPSILVIADEAGPLAVAGIKGGQRAQVGSETGRLILESANFDPVSVRRTSARLGVRTDASKRFENGMSVALAHEVLERFSQLLQQVIGGEIKFGLMADSNSKIPAKRAVELDGREFERLLGLRLERDLIINLLTRLRCKVSWDGEKLRVVVPDDRLDLKLPADIVEEVGRLYGYENIPSEMPTFKPTVTVNELERLTNKIRAILVARGFSEVYSYTLTDKGEEELINPLAADKKYLRVDLASNLREKISANLPQLLFEKEALKLFEIGHIFRSGEEKINLTIVAGWRATKYTQTGMVEEIWREIEKEYDLHLDTDQFQHSQTDTLEWVEVEDLEKLAKQTTDLPDTDLAVYAKPVSIFQPISPYPRIIRDVALFTPVGTDPETIATIIKTQAGALLVEGPALFDQFQKDDKISYAFRLAFQAPDRTLTDEEVNGVIGGVINKLQEQEGWQVR